MLAQSLDLVTDHTPIAGRSPIPGTFSKLGSKNPWPPSSDAAKNALNEDCKATSDGDSLTDTFLLSLAGDDLGHRAGFVAQRMTLLLRPRIGSLRPAAKDRFGEFR